MTSNRTGHEPTPRELIQGPCIVAGGEPPCGVVPAEQHVRRFVPFFVASLALTLGLGATLGMLSLARLTGTWGPLDRSWVWAHGYVQVFGFVGLFVMGFAYHAVPRFVGAALSHPRFVPTTLWLQVGGTLGLAGGFLLPLPDARAQALRSVGAALLVVSALLFLIAVFTTVRSRSLEPQAFEPWIVAGAVWLVASSGIALVATFADDLVAWQHVLWPASLYGFAGSWVFGMGRRLFPSSLGWTPRWRHLDRPSFVLYQAGVACWCAGAWPGEGVVLLRGVGAVALLAAVPTYAAIVGLLGTRRFGHSPLDEGLVVYRRYVRMAWFWLAVGVLAGPGWALGLLAQGSLGSITMLDFSRHTLALGFVTQLIMGMGSRFVPVFCGRRLWSPRAHRWAFWLLNAAVAVRSVQGALAAGHWAEAWPLLALSGPPAVAALTLFALNILMLFHPATVPVLVRRVVPDRRLSVLLGLPGGREALVEGGLTWLRWPLARLTVARAVTLRQACRWTGIALDPLLERLSGRAAGRATDLRSPGDAPDGRTRR